MSEASANANQGENISGHPQTPPTPTSATLKDVKFWATLEKLLSTLLLLSGASSMAYVFAAGSIGKSLTPSTVSPIQFFNIVLIAPLIHRGLRWVALLVAHKNWNPKDLRLERIPNWALLHIAQPQFLTFMKYFPVSFLLGPGLLLLLFLAFIIAQALVSITPVHMDITPGPAQPGATIHFTATGGKDGPDYVMTGYKYLYNRTSCYTAAYYSKETPQGCDPDIYSWTDVLPGQEAVDPPVLQITTFVIPAMGSYVQPSYTPSRPNYAWANVQGNKAVTSNVTYQVFPLAQFTIDNNTAQEPGVIQIEETLQQENQWPTVSTTVKMVLNSDNVLVVINMTSFITSAAVNYRTTSSGMHIEAPGNSLNLKILDEPVPPFLKNATDFLQVLGNVWGGVVPSIFYNVMTTDSKEFQRALVRDMIVARHIRSSYANSATEEGTGTEYVSAAGYNAYVVAGRTRALFIVMLTVEVHLLLVVLVSWIVDWKHIHDFDASQISFVSSSRTIDSETDEP